MSDALAKIYTRQQETIAAQNRQAQAARDKWQREVNAFRNSGIPALFIELADVPIVTQENKPYGKWFSHMTYEHYDPRKNNNSREMVFMDTNGNTAGRWWCEESPDSGRMLYCSDISRSRQHYSTAESLWFDSFLEYVARVCDPAAIAQLHGESGTVVTAKTGKRKLQPIQ